MSVEMIHVSEEGVLVCQGCGHLNQDGKHACGCQCWGSEDVLVKSFSCTEDQGFCPGDDELVPFTGRAEQ